MGSADDIIDQLDLLGEDKREEFENAELIKINKFSYLFNKLLSNLVYFILNFIIDVAAQSRGLATPRHTKNGATMELKYVNMNLNNLQKKDLF